MSGNMATIIVFTDALDEIEKDPDFGRKVAKAVKEVRATDRTCRESFGQAGFVAALSHSGHEIDIRVGLNTATVLKHVIG